MDKIVDKSSELKRGVVVFAVLAVLTAIEYIIGVAEGSTGLVVLLWIIALTKAGLVLWYFMHIARVFRPEGGHE